MKTSHRHRSAGCAGYLNKALYIGTLLSFFGLAGGGVVMAFPTSLGIAPQNAEATALTLSIATLVVAAIFLSFGTAQKHLGASPADGAAKVRG